MSTTLRNQTSRRFTEEVIKLLLWHPQQLSKKQIAVIIRWLQSIGHIPDLGKNRLFKTESNETIRMSGCFSHRTLTTIAISLITPYHKVGGILGSSGVKCLILIPIVQAQGIAKLNMLSKSSITVVQTCLQTCSQAPAIAITSPPVAASFAAVKTFCTTSI